MKMNRFSVAHASEFCIQRLARRARRARNAAKLSQENNDVCARDESTVARDEARQGLLSLARVASRRVDRSLRRMRASISRRRSNKGTDGEACLVLHGWRSNADVSALHARRLRLLKRFRKASCVNGSEEAPHAADETTSELIDGPWFSWVDDASDDTFENLESERATALMTAARSVAKFAIEHGPFKCAVGFSQGGAMITLLSNPQVLSMLGIEGGYLWDSAVICCGASSSLLDLAATKWGIDVRSSASPMPSLHVFGFQDKFKPQGEVLMNTFRAYDSEDQLIRHALYLDCGHTLPASLETDTGFHAEFDAWLEAATEAAPRRYRSNEFDEDVLFDDIKSLEYKSLKFSNQPTIERAEADIERAEAEGARAAQATTFASARTLARNIDVSTATAPSGNDLTFNTRCASLVQCNVSLKSSRVNILDFLARAPRASPLLRSLDGATLTYGQAIDFITKGDGDLRKLGADSSSVFAYNVPPGPVGALAFLAVASQCTAVPLDPGIAEEDAYEALTSCRVSMLALFRGTDTEAIETAASRAHIPIKWFVMTEADTKLAGLYAPESSQSSTSDVAPLVQSSETIGLLLRTSGTTSKSKVVPLVIGALTSNGATLAASLELKASDVCINAMPLFHIGGLSCSILATIAAHSSVICCRKFDAQSFYDTITTSHEVKPTWYSAIPTIHLTVLQYGQAVARGAKPSHALRFIRSGAAALSHADAEKLQRFWDVPIIPTYSMSEQMPITGKGVHVPLAERADTVGQPLCCSFALVGDGHCRLTAPFGQQGELVISGDNVMTAYQDAEEANNKTYFYVADKRYLRTGDIAKMDHDGFVYLTGRSKELIKRGGEQVSPLKVEAVLVQHPYVRVAVIFSVPSALWGEEVGAAIVLTDDFDGHEDSALSSIKSFMGTSKELSRFEIPVHWKFVADEDLPKTSTKKYKRAGLAEILNVAKKVDACTLRHSKKVTTPSHGLAGLRYCMAVSVMFNHIGAIWQGEDERDPLTYGPAWMSAKATTFYFPATTFFVLGGFTLSAALNGKEITKGTWGSFYNSRFQTLFPLYLLSLFLGLINVLVVCRPETFSSEFSWQPHNATLTLDSGAWAQCQTGPVEMPYGAWLFMTLIVFSFGLQTWFPLWLLSSWFMYYTWFNGVYYFIILVFPFMHNALARVKGEFKAVLRWFIVYCVGTLITAGLLGLYYALPAWEEHDDVAKVKSWKENVQNIYALSTMMFPPYWVPCVGTGMAAYFWYDAVRPVESHKRALYGHCADVLTLAFFAFHLAHFLDIDWPYPTNVTGKMWEVVPEEHHRWDTGINRYVWSVMITRLYSPLIAVWIALLSIPKGSRTTRLLESNLLSKVLAPTSYGCFLFHQIIGQWYWWATRNGNGIKTADVGDKTSWMWWAYPKEYYWFSPQPLPVAWYEFFFIVGMTTCFSAAVDRWLNTPLTVLWIKFITFFRNIIWPNSAKSAETSGSSEESSPEDAVIKAVAAVTGVDERVSLDDSFDEIGLVSVGLPVLVGIINAGEQFAVISAQEIATCANLRDVVRIIASKRESARSSVGFGTRSSL